MNIDALITEIVRLRADVDSLLEREVTRYATGTLTPAYAGTGTAGVFTYTNQIGKYIQANGIVFFWGRVTISAIGTPPTGNMQITGFPIANAATYNGQVEFNRVSNFNYAASALELTARIGPSGSVADLEEAFDNAVMVAAPAANFTNAACDLVFSGFYPY